MWVAAAAAAAVLFVGVLAWWPVEQDPRPTTEARLESAWHALADRAPDLFAGTRPLSRTERLAPGGTLRRGGVFLAAPRGPILEDRPRFAWRGGEAAQLRISTATGTPVLAVQDVMSPWDWPAGRPPLARGATYLVEVTVAGVLGVERTSRTFTVVDEAEKQAYERRVAVVRAEVAPPLRPLVLAHVALRQGLLVEARTRARTYVEAAPEDRVGRETLHQALARLGDPEALDVLEVP